MKKIIRSIISSLILLTVNAYAVETVTIVYAFSPADTMAGYSRTLVDEANRIQNKYNFIFDTKPGAGNTIAANYVKTANNHILATSSAFFIRPVLYPGQSYEIDEFKPLLPQCDSPMGVASVKYKSWKDVPKDRPITIGVSGLGVTTHLVALQIVAKYPNISIVPFKSTNDSIIASVGGHVDLTVGFINDLLVWTTDNVKETQKLSVLGVTGNKPIKNILPLSQQGFSPVLSSLNAPHHLVVPKSTPMIKFVEWRAILSKAAQSQSVINACLSDYGAPLYATPYNQIPAWFNTQEDNWKSISQNIKLD
jgi:tripartite-type tricarboxylate transporter receptor subunit TctC